MTTTTRSILTRHLARARFHTMVAIYITSAQEGQTPEELQALWHEGFETFGPEFADAITEYEESK